MSGLRRTIVVATIIATWLVAVGGVGAAERPVFGTPTATSSFGTGIAFEQPVTLTETPTRVEILLTLPGAIGPFVTEVVPPTSIGRTGLRYVYEAEPGSLVPNTRIEARWRITNGDGTEVIGPPADVVYEDDRFAWKTRTDGLVTLHWYEGDDAFAERAVRVASDGLARAQEFLGVTEAEPVDFAVYATTDDIYRALSPDRENVGGQAFPELRSLFARISPDEIGDAWVGTVIPHEITHLVFHTATRNPYGFPPKWVDEGVATYLSEGYAPEYRIALEAAVASNEVIPLSGLVGQFPTTSDGFHLGYAESVAAIDFLVRAHGEDGLKALIRAYGDGKDDDEAFRTAIGMDPDAFDSAFRTDIGAGEPVVSGPMPGPAGPVPDGWAAGGVPAPQPAAPSQPSRPSAPGSPSDVLYVGLSGLFAFLLVGGLVLYLYRRPRGGLA